MKDGSTVLENATDYTVAYADNVDAGIATVTIKAVATSEKYAGETTTTFTIGQKELEDGFIAAIDDQVYTGKAIKPAMTVKDGTLPLTDGKDYTLSYRVLQGHAVTEEEMLATPGSYVVVATLKGNYEGTCELEFTLTADPTTGIGAVTGDGDGTVRYDMSGRRVTKTYRGMVIENGKKRYVKK